MFGNLIVLRQFVESYIEPLLNGGLACGLQVLALCSVAPSTIDRCTVEELEAVFASDTSASALTTYDSSGPPVLRASPFRRPSTTRPAACARRPGLSFSAAR